MRHKTEYDLAKIDTLARAGTPLKIFAHESGYSTGALQKAMTRYGLREIWKNARFKNRKAA